VTVEIAEEAVRGFTVKVKSIDSSGDFKRVWTSEGTGARTLVSIWRPSEGGAESSGDHSHAQTACVGYYATGGDRAPLKESGCAVLRIRDTKATGIGRTSEHIKDVLARYMPHPKRFHQQWNKQTGKEELYCWKPVPPSKRFVSLGVVCTTTPEDPPVESIRCIPRAWVKPVTEEVTQIWNDAGSGGRAGAIWRTNAEGMMAAAQRHTPPHETFYTLKSDEFFINPLDDQSAADIERASKAKFDSMAIVDPGFGFSNEFSKVWDSTKSGADDESSIWRPQLPEGGVFFGDLATTGHEPPVAGSELLICSADHPELLACPAKLKLVWVKKKKVKTRIYVWEAVPPSDDYACIGHVVTTEKPAVDGSGLIVPPQFPDYRVVHRALLQPRSLRKARQIWQDKGFWKQGDDGALWSAPAPIGTFIGAGYPDGGYDVPPGMYHTLSPEVTPRHKFWCATSTRDFAAEDRETQLSFRLGQQLVVVEGVEGDEPWLRGHIGTDYSQAEHLGYFPANHVEIRERLC
jgi:hypothetical protein